MFTPLRATQHPMARHDFLVPTARPDLIVDPHTLRMIEVR